MHKPCTSGVENDERPPVPAVSVSWVLGQEEVGTSDPRKPAACVCRRPAGQGYISCYCGAGEHCGEHNAVSALNTFNFNKKKLQIEKNTSV